MTNVEELARRIGKRRVEAEMEAPEAKTRESLDPIDAIVMISAAMSGKSRQEKAAAYRDLVPGGRVTIEDGRVSVGPQEKQTRSDKAARWREWAEKLTPEARGDYLNSDKYMGLSERQQEFVAQAFSEIEEAEYRVAAELYEEDAAQAESDEELSNLERMRADALLSEQEAEQEDELYDANGNLYDGDEPW
jgi:hypothetical protein